MYDIVLLFPILEKAMVVHCVDNIALVVVTVHLEDAELYSYEAINVVKAWLESIGLALGNLYLGYRDQEHMQSQIRH